MAEVDYVLPLGEDVRKRHRHETVKGSVVSYVVQLEIFYHGAWRPAVRYDSAHGFAHFAHVDRYRRTGESRKEILSFSFAEAVTVADEDIQANWEIYRDRFVRGEWP